MIPKIIHYVWLGNGEKSEVVNHCIESWEKILPDYQIMLWDESTYDLSTAPNFVKEAYQAKKWAFAADYVRLWALNKYGGIYLDTDVEVRKPLDEFLQNRFFIETQTFWVDLNKHKKELRTNLSITVIGSEKGHPFLTDCLNYYDKASIANKDGSIDTTVSNYKYAEILTHYGFQNSDVRQHLDCGIEVYTTHEFGDRLSPTPQEDCYTYHWGEMSWFQPKKRGIFFKLCYELNIMAFYRIVERMAKKIRK